VKTVVQSVAVGVALAPTLEGADWLTSTILWAAVALTVWSGMQYLADARRQAVRLAV
jgi:CDP-diacylglycerol--glycerol-3-phosphate 3-phosphatidyltransferase